MSLRISAFLLFILFLQPKISFAQKARTANQIIETIKQNVTVPWMDKTVDKIIYGSGDTEVTGIAVTFMSTLDVLQRVKAAGCNFIITHEPTFYNHLDDLSIHKKDEVQKAKIKFIKDNDMVIFRFHDHMHRTSPDQIYEGVADRMGWQKYRKEDSDSFEIPTTTLGQFVKELKATSGAETMRIVGNPDMKVSKVGLVLGAAGTAAHFNMIKEFNCDLLIVGESNEWETVPYVQDAQTLGKNLSLIVMGHADSEEAGMIYFQDWLQDFYPNLNIQFIEAGNPYWHGK